MTFGERMKNQVSRVEWIFIAFILFGVIIGCCGGLM